MLSDTNAMEEYFFLGLRKMEGVDVTPYENVYQKVIEKLLKEGLIEKEDSYIRLTELGIDVSNYVLSEFLIEE